MNTYILGAGASLHAGYPLTACLGDLLHAWVCENWKEDFMWRSYIQALREEYHQRADLEHILTELYERPKGSGAAVLGRSFCGHALGAMKVAIPEFFHSIREKPITGPDLYRSLARDWIRSGDVILTFNYDMACERALKSEELWEIGDGYGFAIGADLTPPSKVQVLKLHGSVNWLGILFGGNIGGAQGHNSVFGLRPSLFGRRDFAYLGYPESIHDSLCHGVSRPGGDPALILPTLHKNFFHQTTFGNEWEPFWDYLWNQASLALEASQQIVIIGYSMPVADERARELLLQRSNANAEILVFSGSRTESIRDEFRKAGFRTATSFGECRFQDFLNRYLTRQEAHNRELLRRQKCKQDNATAH